MITKKSKSSSVSFAIKKTVCHAFGTIYYKQNLRNSQIKKKNIKIITKTVGHAIDTTNYKQTTKNTNFNELDKEKIIMISRQK